MQVIYKGQFVYGGGRSGAAHCLLFPSLPGRLEPYASLIFTPVTCDSTAGSAICFMHGLPIQFLFALQDIFNITELHLTYLHTSLDRDAPRTDVRLSTEAEIFPCTGSNPASCPVIPGALLQSSVAVKKGGSYSPSPHNFPSSCIRISKPAL